MKLAHLTRTHSPAHQSRPRNRALQSSGRRRVFGCLAGATLVVGLAAGPAPAEILSSQDSLTPPATTAARAPAAGSVVTTTTVTDPDDVDGRFDVAWVRHVVHEADRRHVWVSYTVRTFPSWIDLRLERRWRTFVLELDRDGQRGSEQNVTVSKRDGHIVAELISNATRQVLREVRISRPDSHSFTISGPRQVLGARSYFWTSNFHARSPKTLCGRSGGFPITCQDSVPQQGWIRMNRSAWPTLSTDLSDRLLR
jgi:hypothetical protein